MMIAESVTEKGLTAVCEQQLLIIDQLHLGFADISMMCFVFNSTSGMRSVPLSSSLTAFIIRGGMQPRTSIDVIRLVDFGLKLNWGLKASCIVIRMKDLWLGEWFGYWLVGV